MLARMRRLIVTTSSIVVATLAVAACSDDGRELREPRPDQSSSISTTIADPVTPDTVISDAGQPTSTFLPGDGGNNIPIGGRTVTAPWKPGATIDERYTCDGINVAPALTWDEAPPGTVAIAIALTDDDQPAFGHWVISGIAPTFVALAEGKVPDGATQAVNGAGVTGYTGPCPPLETAHQYRITVYYLAEQTSDLTITPIDELLAQLAQNAIDIAEVTGVYSRI